MTLPIDHHFPGEDRNWGGSILFVDLIPATCWFTNARSVLMPEDWRRLARSVRQRAGYACEICGFDRQALDVHERWKYEESDGRRIQKLIRLIAICKACHGATHMGLAEMRGQGEEMREHLGRVNRWSEDRVIEHVLAAAARWEERSAHLWDLDVSLLENAGYQPQAAPHAEAREAVAQERLADPFAHTIDDFSRIAPAAQADIPTLHIAVVVANNNESTAVLRANHPPNVEAIATALAFDFTTDQAFSAILAELKTQGFSIDTQDPMVARIIDADTRITLQGNDVHIMQLET
jgi:hypothetical protein